MNFDLSEVTTTVQAMINGFLERLPYLAIALIVFVVFLFVGKGVVPQSARSPSAAAAIATSGWCSGGWPRAPSSSSVC